MLKGKGKGKSKSSASAKLNQQCILFRRGQRRYGDMCRFEHQDDEHGKSKPVGQEFLQLFDEVLRRKAEDRESAKEGSRGTCSLHDHNLRRSTALRFSTMGSCVQLGACKQFRVQEEMLSLFYCTRRVGHSWEDSRAQLQERTCRDGADV